uniref:collagen alpha-1(I) chain n=1 Tax=Nyctereutes procyonoides TaxID=34880 RepID=UPI00244420AA|nr:collagen alpha-1(I) chain [Nyctereutes procyonoides]
MPRAISHLPTGGKIRSSGDAGVLTQPAWEPAFSRRGAGRELPRSAFPAPPGACGGPLPRGPGRPGASASASAEGSRGPPARGVPGRAGPGGAGVGLTPAPPGQARRRLRPNRTGRGREASHSEDASPSVWGVEGAPRGPRRCRPRPSLSWPDPPRSVDASTRLPRLKCRRPATPRPGWLPSALPAADCQWRAPLRGALRNPRACEVAPVAAGQGRALGSRGKPRRARRPPHADGDRLQGTVWEGTAEAWKRVLTSFYPGMVSSRGNDNQAAEHVQIRTRLEDPAAAAQNFPCRPFCSLQFPPEVSSS